MSAFLLFINYLLRLLRLCHLNVATVETVNIFRKKHLRGVAERAVVVLRHANF